MAEDIETVQDPAEGQHGPVITLDRWLKTLRGTEDEVYSRLMRVEAKVKVAEAAAWALMLNDLRSRPAHKQ